MKSQKGITLVALIITVIVMTILATISIQSGVGSLDNTRLQAFYAELEIIQKRVDDISVTNESYIDNNGNLLYIKEQGKDLTSFQQSLLQGIIQEEKLNIPVDNFRYFTIQDLQDILDLNNLEYNVFIDFENRVVVSEEGIKVGSKTYYVLENATYFVKHNDVDKNKGTIHSLNYKVIKYGDKYKVTVIPSNSIGDVQGTGHIKYKKTTNQYWESQNNTEMIIEKDIQYNLIYIDNNNNSIEKIIEVNINTSNELVVNEQ